MLSAVVSRLQELMSMFNPILMSSSFGETYMNGPQYGEHSTLLELAQEVSLYLQKRQHSWKLVLVFVQVDQICACDQEKVQSAIRSAVKEVDAVLLLLHAQLKRTIVSVALRDGERDTSHSKSCPCLELAQGEEVRLQKAILARALQDSLDELLVEKHWYSDRNDFTVILQDTPLITHVISANIGKPLSESQASHETDKLMVQLWTNLLQPTSAKHNTDDDGNIIALQCPTEDRPFVRTKGNSPINHTSSAFPPVHPTTGTKIPCEDGSPSDSTPTSVHELRPGDIRVVAAIGDSLTAGNGIGSSQTNIVDVLTQYRGLSWSIGGDGNLTTVTTLPNILKHFNPNVTGYSVGKGKEHTPQAFFNQAVQGAKSKDLLKQAHALVARMKNSTINFESDWKVITVFIGGNDICDHCQNSLFFSVENYVNTIQESLDYLHKEVPRALVNLIEPIHITPLRKLHVNATLKCPTWLVQIMCPCVVLPKPSSTALKKLEELNSKYQLVLNELVESKRYDTRRDFTVVIQPFFREIIVPKLPDGRVDRSFFSADCFHLSQRAQTQMARALWNNMLEPLGNKTALQDFSTDIELKCPSETSPYFRTYHNSNYTYVGPSPTPAPNKNWGSDFSCVDLAPSDTVPTSVHKLRPADIKVVAALGDSVTAGTGAKARTLLDLNREYKGVSWSIGGDHTLDTVTTLPNILRKFNSALKGFSKGQGSRQKGFNMAVDGATTLSIQDQIKVLINAMKEHKDVNFEEDWKLLTIFVGGNDLCHYCIDQNNLSPKNYSHNLMLALDTLHKEVPRMLVNLVEIMQIDTLKEVKKNTLGCSLLQRISCPCVINPTENSPELEEIKRINHEYQAEIHNLISGSHYDQKEDFAVVLQPFLHNSFIPYIGEGEADASFFSLDCFHISERAHAEMAIALWNNMLEPVGRKQAYNNFTYDRSKIHCPSEASPFIFTRVNSSPPPPVTATTVPPPNNITAFTTTTTQTAFIPLCVPPQPAWVTVVVGVVCLFMGVTIAVLIFSFVLHRKSQTKYAVECAEYAVETKTAAL
ncbi:phospholipase B1, membrane-associated-like [Nerophis lumbriciformis]|uniref:phospholipase B1, membrane-associated-like n=1 Tax=Nerophis lumbriciformis TaxID=546530 RepID=UPI003BA9FEF9